MKTSAHQYVVCLDNEGYAASLERLKLYRALPDAEAAALDLLRIVDESGEDYLYPTRRFAPIEVGKSIVKAFRAKRIVSSKRRSSRGKAARRESATASTKL